MSNDSENAAGKILGDVRLLGMRRGRLALALDWIDDFELRRTAGQKLNKGRKAHLRKSAR